MMENKQEQMLINEQYLTVKKIGQGGFGVVWKAYDFSLRNFVAIKELLPEYTEPKFVEMFYREALIAKNIIHDNVVRVQHFWQGNNGAYYISMDYVNGNDLEHLMEKCKTSGNKLSWELIVLICGSVLRALDHANRIAKDTITNKPYGIVYRDISPGNVIISFEGGIKLSDFGIAQTADDFSFSNKKRIVTGKYGYMSPEQTRGDTDIDHRSDIFSVGVVLYEMLMGRKLFNGTPEEIKKQVLELDFDPTELYNLNVPDELVDIVAKAISRDREHRYEKAIEMFRDLRRLLKGKETEELTLDLAAFINKILQPEIAAENQLLEKVKELSLQDVKGDPAVKKINCRDFIVGETPSVYTPEEAPKPAAAAPAPAAAPAKKTEEKSFAGPLGPIEKKMDEILKAEKQAPKDANNAVVGGSAPKPAAGAGDDRPKAEEKGKTVFEEVGDWLVNKFKGYRRKVIRGGIALVIALILFVVVDAYVRITFIGKGIYSWMYPPDVVVSTYPPGARVSIRGRDGKIVLSDADSESPIELRKVPPKTYIITATKEGFKTVERIVRIDEKQNKSGDQQRIDIYFDFPVVVNSKPEGAEVYIDGNKFKAAPWKGELNAGEHTIKLKYEGFEELGSLAKEVKEGQCNIDFTRGRESEMFSGMDQRFWSYEITTVNGEKVFNITGNLYKKFDISSSPRNMVVHIQSEAQPRGNTPLNIALRAGEYKIRFMDPDGRYEETSRTVRVDKDSKREIFAALNKWVTVKVMCKEQSDKVVRSGVHITGNGINLVKEISSSHPLRLALPVGAYRISFESNGEYKPLVLKSVNIGEQNTIVGEMELATVQLKLVVKDEITEAPIENAFVWMLNKVVGTTDKAGVWESEIRPGKWPLKVVTKGYTERAMEKAFEPGQKETIVITLAPEKPAVALDTATVSGINRIASPGGKKPAAEQKPAVKAAPEAPAQDGNGADQTKVEASGGKRVIVCPNCKKEYIVTGTKKPRFCTNCGKPFR